MKALLLMLSLLLGVTSSLRMIQLRSVHNQKYVTVYWPAGNIRVDSEAYAHASTYEVHVVGGSQWQLRAVKNNNYLCAQNGGGGAVNADRASASGWETFNPVFLAGNQVQLKTFSGNWVGMNSNLDLVATATTPLAWETFVIVDIPQLRGANLGAWFVPEKWMFQGNSSLWSGTSAHDYYSLCSQLGQQEAARRMSQHWATWFTTSDFDRLKNQGVNFLRLPFGYWDIDSNSAPYVTGGAAYIDSALTWAAKYDMWVLLDLHGAPGSQNGMDHSGQSGAIRWQEPQNVGWTLRILEEVARRWANHPRVWGIELLNEPHYSLDKGLLTSFYRDAYSVIRKHHASVHVVINSLYGPHEWTGDVLPEPQYRNVILDLHLYTPWSGFTTPQQHLDQAKRWADEIRVLVPLYPVIVGEFSLATGLNPYTDDVRRQFAENEMTSFENNAMGWNFWNQKLEYYSVDWALVDGFPYVQRFYKK